MTKSELVKKIRALHKKREPLNISAVRENYPELLKAAYSFKPYLGWKQALELAGLNYKSIRFDLADIVKCKICGNYYRMLMSHLFSAHGINGEEYQLEFPDAPIMSEDILANITKMKSPVPAWEPALSLEYVLDRVWFWYSKYGQQAITSITLKDESVYTYLQTHKISKDQIFSYLGIDPFEKYEIKYPTPESVIAELKDRHRRGLSILQNDIVKEDSSLKSAVYVRFGSWLEAIKQAKLTKARKEILDTHVRKDAVYASAEEVIQGLKKRFKSKKSLSQHEVTINDQPLKSGAYRCFGSWSAALEAAGLNEFWKKQKEKNPPGKPAAYPTAKSVIVRLQEKATRGEALSSYKVYVDERVLHSGVYRHFKSWKEAIKAANLLKKFSRETPRSLVKYRSREDVIKAIQKRHQKGQSLSCGVVQKEDGQLKARAFRYFGSWVKARKAAGCLYY